LVLSSQGHVTRPVKVRPRYQVHRSKVQGPRSLVLWYIDPGSLSTSYTGYKVKVTRVQVPRIKVTSSKVPRITRVQVPGHTVQGYRCPGVIGPRYPRDNMGYTKALEH